MSERNQIIVNGASTLDFPFETKVTQNAGFLFPNKKNRIVETNYGSGAIKDDIRAWEPITKSYELYCRTDDVKELREIKSWASDEGQLISGDELDVFYEILDVDISGPKDETIPGYYLDISFLVQPFGYELDQPVNTYTNGETITNHTNAPMYPRITLYGDTSEQTSFKIGEQEIFIKRIDEEVTIENKHLEQTVLDNLEREVNNIMLGDFIEIPEESESVITLGEGITEIEMLERWAWL